MFWLIVIVILLVILNNKCCISGFSSRPTDGDIEKFSTDLLKNQHIVNSGKMTEAREKMPWIDPVIFEEARNLNNNNKFDKQTIKSLFY